MISFPQIFRDLLVRKPGPEEGLVGVDVPDPGKESLIQQRRLEGSTCP